MNLFIELEADEAQLDFPVVYASARDGTSTMDLDTAAAGPRRRCSRRSSPRCRRRRATRRPVPDARCPRSTTRHTSAASASAASSAARRTSATWWRCCRSTRTSRREQSRITKLFSFDGLDRDRGAEAAAGEIVALAGLEGVEIGLTVTDIEHPERLEGIAVEEPTISVDFMVNNSPFAGKEGKFVTSRQVRERLYRELERNVALRVEDTDSTDTWTVSGRGELHLTILMETMRREGYEFQVSRPRVITREGPSGERLEPYEELAIDVPEAYLGT